MLNNEKSIVFLTISVDFRPKDSDPDSHIKTGSGIRFLTRYWFDPRPGGEVYGDCAAEGPTEDDDLARRQIWSGVKVVQTGLQNKQHFKINQSIRQSINPSIR